MAADSGGRDRKRCFGHRPSLEGNHGLIPMCRNTNSTPVHNTVGCSVQFAPIKKIRRDAQRASSEHVRAAPLEPATTNSARTTEPMLRPLSAETCRPPCTPSVSQPIPHADSTSPCRSSTPPRPSFPRCAFSQPSAAHHPVLAGAAGGFDGPKVTTASVGRGPGCGGGSTGSCCSWAFPRAVRFDTSGAHSRQGTGVTMRRESPWLAAFGRIRAVKRFACVLTRRSAALFCACREGF